MVKWLEILGYGTEGPRYKSELASFYESGEDRQETVRVGLCLSYAVPKLSKTLIPTVPMITRLWETFTFNINMVGLCCYYSILPGFRNIFSP